MSYISILIFFTAGGCTFLFLAFLQVFFSDMFSNKTKQNDVSKEPSQSELPVPELPILDTKETPETTPTIIVNTTINNITNIKIKEEQYHEH